MLYIIKQHSGNSDDFIDVFLQEKKLADSQKACASCGCESDMDYRVCRNCGGKTVKETVTPPNLVNEIDISPYKSFESFPSSLPNITCKTGEPDFLNPNSYNTIVQVIQNIGFRAGIKQYGGNKEWLFIECDGLPYNTLREIIANIWRCCNCNHCFYRIEKFEEHKCYILHNAGKVREFSWLVPVSGLFHLELNACRAFIKLNWEIFAGKLGYVLGFQSPKAQQYLQKGSDHHKAWHFLEILYISLSLELVVPYAKEHIVSKTVPTISGYWQWCEETEDPNYAYVQHAVFTHLYSL